MDCRHGTSCWSNGVESSKSHRVGTGSGKAVWWNDSVDQEPGALSQMRGYRKEAHRRNAALIGDDVGDVGLGGGV